MSQGTENHTSPAEGAGELLRTQAQALGARFERRFQIPGGREGYLSRIGEMNARVVEVVRELERQHATRLDIGVSEGGIVADPTSGQLLVSLPPGGSNRVPETVVTEAGPFGRLGLSRYADDQLADKTGIPRKYYQRIRGLPKLWAENVNAWIDEAEKNRLVRIQDGQVRALLSGHYRIVDNLDLAVMAIKESRGLGATPVRADLGETKMHLAFVNAAQAAELKAGSGDFLSPAFLMTNSEVGAGAVNLEMMLFRYGCSNGLIVGEAMRKIHLGGELALGEILSQETKVKQMDAILSATRDYLKASLDPARFQAAMEIARSGAQKAIPNPTKAIEVLAQEGLFSKHEADLVLKELLEGKDFTLWGLVNATTAAGRQADADRGTELERLGGQIGGFVPSTRKLETLVMGA